MDRQRKAFPRRPILPTNRSRTQRITLVQAGAAQAATTPIPGQIPQATPALMAQMRMEREPVVLITTEMTLQVVQPPARVRVLVLAQEPVPVRERLGEPEPVQEQVRALAQERRTVQQLVVPAIREEPQPALLVLVAREPNSFCLIRHQIGTI